MIVFDLKCEAGDHVFEAWFGSSRDFDDQRARGLLACPVCGDSGIGKAIMAPNVGAKGNSALVPAATQTIMATEPANPVASEIRAMMSKIATLQAESLKSSKWVGKDFERQARAMDTGETPHATIHGQATPDQARALVEDGIGVMPLLVPFAPPEEQN